MDFRYPDKPITATPEFLSDLREESYIGQSKYDGWRLQIYRNNGLHLLSRVGSNILDTNAKFPRQLISNISSLQLPEDTVLDSEFVGPRGDHKPAIYIFDCIKWNGQWQGTIPYTKRWEICKSLELNDDILLADTFDRGFLNKFNTLKNDWLKIRDLSLYEGIVVKLRRGTLTLSRNSNTKSKSMFKIKFRDIREQRY